MKPQQQGPLLVFPLDQEQPFPMSWNGDQPSKAPMSSDASDPAPFPDTPCPDSLPPQAVWALGNIAGDSPACRDLVLNNGALPPLMEQLQEHSKISMLRNATWTMSNFCRGKPQPNFEQVGALPLPRKATEALPEELSPVSMASVQGLGLG